MRSLLLFTKHSSSNFNVNKTFLLGVRKHLHVNTLKKGCLKGLLKITSEVVRKRSKIDISFAVTASFCDNECVEITGLLEAIYSRTQLIKKIKQTLSHLF